MLSLRGKVQKLRTDHASLSLDPKGMSTHFPGTCPHQGEAGEGKDEGGKLYGKTK